MMSTPTLLDLPTAAAKLTPGETRALAAIDSFLAANGYPPTTRDLAAGIKTRSSYAGRMLDALEAKGAIRRTPGRARGLVVLDREDG